MKPVRVSLTEEDRLAARACAKRRVGDALRVGAVDRFGVDSETSHYWGALGEIAAAKALGVAWSPTSMVWSVEDVVGFEVRSIPPGVRLYLKAKDNDPDDRRIILVAHVSDHEAMVMGWTTAADIRRAGRRADWGNRGAPAYMLTSLSVLREMA